MEVPPSARKLLSSLAVVWGNSASYSLKLNPSPDGVGALDTFAIQSFSFVCYFVFFAEIVNNGGAETCSLGLTCVVDEKESERQDKRKS